MLSHLDVYNLSLIIGFLCCDEKMSLIDNFGNSRMFHVLEKVLTTTLSLFSLQI